MQPYYHPVFGPWKMKAPAEGSGVFIEKITLSLPPPAS
jgi:hypothetical protein